MTLTANWSYPTTIRFGAGRIAEIADACAATGMKKPLLVTDRGLAPLPITVAALDLLDAAGLLQDGPWTTHWEDIDTLAETVPAAGAQRGVRWADAGTVVTSGGLTAGIDMALHIVDRLAGTDLAEQTARQLDHPWTRDPST